MKYLRQGHFLPIRDRTDFKITPMAFKAILSLGPKYLQNLVVVKDPNAVHALSDKSNAYIMSHTNLLPGL